MDTIADLLEPDDVRMLVDIGFMALSHDFVESAEAIFAGVIAARPAQEAGHIGKALLLLHRGDVDEAVAVLRALPPTDAARLFLGLAVSRTGDVAQARSILADVAEATPDAAHSASARALLDALPG